MQLVVLAFITALCRLHTQSGTCDATYTGSHYYESNAIDLIIIIIIIIWQYIWKAELQLQTVTLSALCNLTVQLQHQERTCQHLCHMDTCAVIISLVCWTLPLMWSWSNICMFPIYVHSWHWKQPSKTASLHVSEEQLHAELINCASTLCVATTTITVPP